MRSATLFALLASVAALAILMFGCGYKTGHLAGGDGRSLAVPAFTNETFRRDLERDLTRAVRQEVRTRTDYRLVEPAGADLLLTGKVLEISETVLSERGDAEIRESSVRVAVEVTVTEVSTGKLLVDRRRLSERKSFVPVKAESVRTAEAAALRTLAEKIVTTLASDW